MKRGEIWWIKAGDSTGSEQRNNRPGIIVSNDVCNTFSPTIQMVPLTTARKKPLPTHVIITSGSRPSTAMCEQIITVDKDRLMSYMGHVYDHEMAAIEEAMKIQLGM